MLIYWVEAYILQEKHRSCSSC